MSIEALTWAWQQNCPTPTEKLVLLALADHANEPDFECFPGVRRLSNFVGVSDRTIQRAIQSLIFEGMLIVEPRYGEHGGHTSNLYRLKVAPGDTDDTRVVNQASGGGDTDDTTLETPVSPQEPSDEPSTNHQENDGDLFEGEIIRLTAEDFNRWAAAFPSVNLRAELTSRDAWLTTQPPGDQKRWFVSTAAYLAKLQRGSGGNGQQKPAGYDAWGDPVDEQGHSI